MKLKKSPSEIVDDIKASNWHKISNSINSDRFIYSTDYRFFFLFFLFLFCGLVAIYFLIYFFGNQKFDKNILKIMSTHEASKNE